MANSDHAVAEIDEPLPIFKRPKHDKEDDVKSDLAPSQHSESKQEPISTTNSGPNEVNSPLIASCGLSGHLLCTLHCPMSIID